MKKIKKYVPRPLRSYLKTVRNFIYRIYYRGNKVECQICNSKFKKFATYGGGMYVRENALCPNCGSLERHRLLWLYIKSRLNKGSKYEPMHVIHFAPEKFMYKLLSQKENVNYYPCDLFPEVYPFGEINKIDITNINLESDRFDVVLCNHVLEHILDDRKAMSELFRIMKNDSWGIVQVPIELDRDYTYEDDSIVTPAEREKHFGQSDHVRIYGRDYIERLKSVGFEVQELDFVAQYSNSDIQKLGLDENEILFIIRK